MGWTSRANTAVTPGRSLILPWGMAMPLPRPVEPSCSRATSVSKMVWASTPTRPAAFSARSSRSWRLLATFAQGITDSCDRMSASSIEREPFEADCSHHGASGIRERRVYPPDISIGAAVNHIHAPMSSMAERNHVRLGEIELHHGLAHAHGPEARRALGDNRGGEIGGQVLVLVGDGKNIGGILGAVARAIGAETPVVLEPALVAPQPLGDGVGHGLIGHGGLGRLGRGLEHDARVEMDDAIGPKADALGFKHHVAVIATVEIFRD